MIKNLAIGLSFLAASGECSASSDERNQAKDKDFVWYCEADEATTAQKDTVKKIYQQYQMDRQNLDCKSAFNELKSFGPLYFYFESKTGTITDLAPLRGLDQTAELHCTGCTMAAVDSLPALPKLKALGLVDNGFAEVPDVNRFPKLTHLTLREPLKEGVDPDRMANITHLSLGASEMPSLGFLSYMPKLWSLTIKELKPKVLKTILPLPNLRIAAFNDLYLPSDQFGFLSKLPGITSLSLASNYLTTLEGMTLPAGLKSLNLDENRLSNMPLGILPKGLEELNLDYNLLKDYDFLQELTSLKQLSAINSDFSDWQALSAMQGTLEKLDLERTNIRARTRTPDDKQSWPKLTDLNLSHTNIQSLAFFKDFNMPVLSSFFPPVIRIKTEENCPTSGVPEAIAKFCR